MAAPPVTVTVSASAAGLSPKLRTAFWSMTSVTSERISDVNPVSSAFTEYRLAAARESGTWPTESLTPERRRPVSLFCAETVAPGITPPLSSLMIPLIWPFCASARAAPSVRKTATAASNTKCLLMRASI